MRSTITLYVCDKCWHEDPQPMNVIELRKWNRPYQEKIKPKQLDLCDACYDWIQSKLVLVTEATDVRE